MLSLRSFAGIVATVVLLSATSAARADDHSKALEYLGRGASAYRMGDLVEATRHWKEAARFCRLAGEPGLEAEALARRGEALQFLGQYRDAVNDLEQAAAEAEKAADRAELAAVTGALGNVYFHARQFAKARAMLSRSLDLAREMGLKQVAAASENNLGNLLAASRDNLGAERAYRQSIENARAASDGALLATALINEARILLRTGDAKKTLAVLNEAMRELAMLPSSREKVYALLALGYVAKSPVGSASEPHEELRPVAYEALQTATKLAEDRGDTRAASLGWGYLGELYEGAERRDEARRLAGRAAALAEKTDAPDLLYRWEWLKGRLARAAGNRLAAIGDYRRAVAALEDVRQDIPVDYVDGRSSFRETVGPLYFELSDLLLQEAPAADPTLAQRLLMEARDTVEKLKTAEVRDYFSEQCLTALQAKETAVERVGGSAAKRTAVLYPIILPDRIEMLVSFADKLQQFTSRVDKKTFVDTAHRLRLGLETLGKRDYLEPAKQLYNWLIRPIDAELERRHIDTLVVIPDGVLRTIPFSTLYDGKQFLIGKYAIGTAPGLSLIDPRPIISQKGDALLAGLSTPVQGYAPLRFVSEELSTLNKIYRGDVLKDKNFRLEVFEDDLKAVPYTIVHIASHGEFDSNPEKTFILTFDGKLTLDALEQAVKYSEFREQPLELLTLSACRTAAGDDRAALGLAGVAIKAGARSAVASLWFVSDEASSRLIGLFYQKLAHGKVSKAKAMQEAQLELMKDLRFRHPGYWAPFLVIGNWL